MEATSRQHAKQEAHGHIARLRIQFKSISVLGGPLFEETLIPVTQGCFVPSLVEIGSVALEKKIFKFHQCIFAIS